MKQNYSNVRAIIITRRILNRYLDLYILRKIPCVGRNNYYCGITNDLKRRFEEHHLTLDHLVCFYNCPTVEIAKKVEQLLENKGFDLGHKVANGGTEDSTIVYLVYKVAGFL